MLIISQDEEKIINFDNITSIEIDDTFNNNEISLNSNNGQYYIGIYKTRERAKEVLQEIIKSYRICEYYKIDSMKFNNKIISEFLEYSLYEMPKE